MTGLRCLLACGALAGPTGVASDPLEGSFTLGARQFEEATSLSSGSSAWFGTLEIGGSLSLWPEASLEYNLTQTTNFDTGDTFTSVRELDFQLASDVMVLSVGRGALGWSANDFSSPSDPFFAPEDDVLDFEINAQTIDRAQLEYHFGSASLELVVAQFSPKAPEPVFGVASGSATVRYDMATFDGTPEAETQYGIRVSTQLGATDVSWVLADAYESRPALMPDGLGAFVPTYAKSLQTGVLVEGEIGDTGVLFDLDYGWIETAQTATLGVTNAHVARLGLEREFATNGLRRGSSFTVRGDLFWDSRGDEALSELNNDFMLTLTSTINDPSDTTVFLRHITDLDTDATGFVFGANRRIGDDLRVGIEYSDSADASCMACETFGLFGTYHF